MPRKDFLRDLQEVSNLGEPPEAYPRLVDIKPGEDDGAIAFTYVPEYDSSQPIEIQALISGEFCRRPLAEFVTILTTKRYLVISPSSYLFCLHDFG